MVNVPGGRGVQQCVLERIPQGGGVDESVVVDFHDELCGRALTSGQPLEHECCLDGEIGIGINEVLLQDVTVPLMLGHKQVLWGTSASFGTMYGIKFVFFVVKVSLSSAVLMVWLMFVVLMFVVLIRVFSIKPPLLLSSTNTVG